LGQDAGGCFCLRPRLYPAPSSREGPMSHRRTRTRACLRLRIAWISCMAIGSPGIAWSAEPVILDVRGYAQETEQWCWAASGQAVMGFLAPELKGEVCQCRQAELRL